jgi:transposase
MSLIEIIINKIGALLGIVIYSILIHHIITNGITKFIANPQHNWTINLNKLYCLKFMRYSNDLRKKVVKLITDQYIKKSIVSKMFSLSRTTIDSWLLLQKAGSLFDVTPRDYSNSAKLNIQTPNSYLQDKSNSDKYQYEMAIDLGVSPTNIWNKLQKLGYSHKKNKKVSKKPIQKKDQNI